MKGLFVLLFAWTVLSVAAIHAEDNQHPKVLVLIICSDDLPVYQDLQKVWRSYMHLDPDHFESYFIKGNSELASTFLIKDDVIWSRSQESVCPGLLNKTLFSLEAISPRFNEFDYVLRCNLSSFFVFPLLLDFLKDAPRDKFYCGIHHGKGTPHHESGWVCGAGIVMSTDLAKLLLNDKENLLDLSPEDPSNLDDVVIADYFSKNSVPIRRGLCREVLKQSDAIKLVNNIPNDIFHFRIKIDPSTAKRSKWYYFYDKFFPPVPPTRATLEPPVHRALLYHFYDKTI